MRKFTDVIAASAVAASAVVCATVANADGDRSVQVSHAPDSDSWWSTIKTAMALVRDRMGVTVD